MSKVGHYLLFHFSGRMGIYRLHGSQSSILLVGNFIERRHVDSGNLCRPLQKLLPASAFLPHFPVSIQQGKVRGLALSDIEEIEKFCQRLRICGAGPASDHDRVLPGTFCGAQRDAAQVQNLKNIRVAHFVLERNSQKVKFPHRVLGFQREQRDVLFSHELIQIYPGRIDALAPDILPLIEHVIEDLDTQMGHADLIHVRETHAETDIHLLRVLDDCVDLISEIPGRLVYFQ